MATIDDAPKGSFRLEQLFNDTRYRSTTIQVIVLVGFLLFLGWLANNTIENLAQRDKDISFSFLWQRAGYDIDQHLIPYSNDDTHGRALVVGLLNTLVVAFFGSLFATMIGTLVGILRLSNNWLLSRVTAIYVEVFRNIPLLLWIILAFVILGVNSPSPNDFKVTDALVAAGEKPAASMWLWDSIAVTNRGTNIPAPTFERSFGSFEILGVPVHISIVVMLAIIALSYWANYKIVERARAVQEMSGLIPTTWWKSLIVLFLPTICFLVLMRFHLVYPVLNGFNFQGGLKLGNSLVALVIAVSLYSATYIAEIVRAGILAIPRGQSEASSALGFHGGRTMRLIVLPQALRVIVPPLISQYLNITKNSTLGMAISYLDLKGTLGGITLNQTGRELECMLLMMLIYVVISLIISSFMNLYNNAVQLKGR